MPVEFFLGVVVLAVVILVAADFFRTSSDSPHEHAAEAALDAERETFPEPRALATAFLPPPARAGGAGQAFDAGPPRQPTRMGPPAGGQHLEGGTVTPRRGSRGAQKNWLGRIRIGCGRWRERSSDRV